MSPLKIKSGGHMEEQLMLFTIIDWWGSPSAPCLLWPSFLYSSSSSSLSVFLCNSKYYHCYLIFFRLVFINISVHKPLRSNHESFVGWCNCSKSKCEYPFMNWTHFKMMFHQVIRGLGVPSNCQKLWKSIGMVYRMNHTSVPSYAAATHTDHLKRLDHLSQDIMTAPSSQFTGISIFVSLSSILMFYVAWNHVSHQVTYLLWSESCGWIVPDIYELWWGI